MRQNKIMIFLICIFIFMNIYGKGKIDHKTIIMNGDLVEIGKLIKEDPSFINKSVNSFGWRPLLYAVESKNLKTVKYLLKKGAVINQKSKTGWSPLTRAVEINSQEITDFLLTKKPLLLIEGKLGIRFVHKAARGGFSKLTEILIKKGVDTNGKDQMGNILLHSAAIGGLARVCEVLIAKGSDVDKRNNYHLSPLHFAAIYGRFNVIRILLKHKASLDIKSFLGKTPIQFAIENGCRKIVTYLEKKGAVTKKFEFPILEGAYLGQKKPGNVAKLFAQEIISTYLIEHGSCVFSKDGNEIYWSQRKMFSTTHSIMIMKRIHNRWMPPKKLEISKGFSNSDPTLDPKTGRLIFTSNNPLDQHKKPGSGNLLVSEKQKGVWTQPKFLDPILNSISSDGHASLSKRGTLYFESGRAGGYGLYDIYMSDLVDGKYTKPKNLGNKINTNSFDCLPFIAPDESYLIFESYRKENIGRGDLYISFRDEDGDWSEPMNMGPTINTKKGRETLASLSPDGKYLFFSSDKKGSLDTYWIDAGIIKELKNIYIKKRGETP